MLGHPSYSVEGLQALELVKVRARRAVGNVPFRKRENQMEPGVAETRWWGGESSSLTARTGRIAPGQDKMSTEGEMGGATCMAATEPQVCHHLCLIQTLFRGVTSRPRHHLLNEGHSSQPLLVECCRPQKAEACGGEVPMHSCTLD